MCKDIRTLSLWQSLSSEVHQLLLPKLLNLFGFGVGREFFLLCDQFRGDVLLQEKNAYFQLSLASHVFQEARVPVK